MTTLRLYYSSSDKYLDDEKSEKIVEGVSLGEDDFLFQLFQLASKYHKLSDSELEFIKILSE